MNNTLNDIRLDPVMLETLYKNALVLPEAAPPAPKTHLKYLGTNGKQVTLLVNYSAHTFLPEDELAFLTKMLGACKMNIGDVALVNTAQGIDFLDLVSQLAPSTLIAFGTGIPGVEMPPFTIQDHYGITCLQVSGLREISGESDESKLLKGKLWNCLKHLFGL